MEGTLSGVTGSVGGLRAAFRWVLTSIAIWGALTLLLWAYTAGLSGPFLLDDFQTLQGLARVQGNLTWENIRAYLNTGITGPTGRPLALLTFLLDSKTWPAPPESFKHTNVLLHGVNGVLVFLISSHLIQKVKGQSSRWSIAAGLLALAWVLNPYHVSTVLYVVQRMAILSALFVLLGILLYLKGRELVARSAAKGTFLILVAYVVGAGLGTLSKENAALFVLFVPVIEWIFFSDDHPSTARVRRHLRFMVLVPAVALLLALAARIPVFLESYASTRDFTLGERLLSQPRAVGYYLWRYLIPGTGYVGIYGDGFQKSTSLLDPLSTLLWILAHAAILLVGIKARKRWPLLSFGIVFFYVGHLIESSIVPLELFFEHRSYLPSAFLWLGLISFGAFALTVPAIVLLVMANVSFLKNEVTIWGDTVRFTQKQVEKSPESERAHVALAELYVAVARNAAALEALRDYAQHHGAGQDAALLLMSNACALDDVRQEDINILLRSPYEYRGRSHVFQNGVGALLDLVYNDVCAGLTYEDLRKLLDNYKNAYQRSAWEMRVFYALHAKLALAEGDYEQFVVNGLAAADAYPDISYRLDFCSSLASMGVGDECDCLHRGDPLKKVGVQRTLTRSLLGYEETLGKALKSRQLAACGGKLQR